MSSTWISSHEWKLYCTVKIIKILHKGLILCLEVLREREREREVEGKII